jgi:hypothetical protein
VKYFCITINKGGRPLEAVRDTIEDAIELCTNRSKTETNIYAAVATYKNGVMNIIWTPEEGFNIK